MLVGDDRDRPAGRLVRPDRGRHVATRQLVFAAFILAFAIKAPVWPLHGWLPDAYRSAPPEVAAVLSGVGVEGRRVRLPAHRAADLPRARRRVPVDPGRGGGDRAAVRLAARVPPARLARRDRLLVDRARWASSTLGIFALNDQGATGAAFQMVNHGLLSAALFLLAGWVAHTTGQDAFAHLGGLARGRPVLATIVIIVGVAALAVPGSSAFASEFLVLLGAFEAKAAVGVIASLAVVLAAMYMLRWISAILHDREGDAVGATNPPELRGGGFRAVIPLVAAVLALSFYPHAVTRRVDAPASQLAVPAAAEAAK